MYYIFNQIIKSLNSSKFFAGIMMIILNIGSKFITIKFSENQEEYLRNYLGRQILIFAISFIATKDIIVSLALTAIFMILADHLFNEESRLCILPSNFIRFKKVLDIDKNDMVSNSEINKAIGVLNKAKMQKEYFTKLNTYHKFKQFAE